MFSFLRGHLSIRSSFKQCLIRICHQTFITSCTTLKEVVGKVHIVLNESDLSEKFVRGSGPGGQSVNKSNNCVQLTHIPTGIMVSSHESRELTANRKTARRKLIELLDIRMNGDQSKVMKRVAKKQRRKSKSRRWVCLMFQSFKTNQKIVVQRRSISLLLMASTTKKMMLKRMI